MKKSINYSTDLLKKICFLAKSILTKKIPIECSIEYKYVLDRMMKKKCLQTT